MTAVTKTYGGTLRDLLAQSDDAARTVDPDVGAWFKAGNGQVGQCVAAMPSRLLIDYGPGVRRWRRRGDLRFVTL